MGSKGLALLAYLARRRGDGVLRDELLAVFWPEASGESARTSLRSAIYRLNHRCGVALVESGSSGSVRIVEDAFSCDSAEFEAAIAAGDWPEAMALYGGDYLPGLHVDGSSEFENWVERERRHLRTAAKEAAWTLADLALVDDPQAARRWALNALELDPLNEASLRRCLRLLAGIGDRAGLAETYDSFVARLQEELEVEPASETRTLRDALERELDEWGGGKPLTGADHAVRSPPSSGPDGLRPGERAPTPRIQWVFSAAAVLAIAGVVFLASPGGPAAEEAGEPTIRVLPFEYTGNPELAYLGDGVGEILGRRLEQEGASVAIGVGGGTPGEAATYLVSGSASVIEGRLELSVVVRDAADTLATLTEASTSGPVETAFQLIDEIAYPVLAVTRSEPWAQVNPGADEGTSLAALKAVLEGEALARDARFAEALVFFRRAVEEDSTFAWALYGQARAADWLGYTPEAREATERAWRYASRLPERERVLLGAWRASMIPEAVTADSLFQRVTERFPFYDEGWLRLAEHRYHWGPLVGIPVEDARRAFERAAQLAPRQVASPLHLLRLAVRRGDREAAGTLLDRLQATPLEAGERIEVELLEALLEGNDVSARSLTPEQLEAAALNALVNVPDPEPSVRFLRSSARENPESYAVLAALLRRLLANGRVREAKAMLPALAHVHATVEAEWAAEMATLPGLPRNDDDLEAARGKLLALGLQSPEEASRSMFLRVGDIHASRLHYFLGLLEVRSGGFEAARAHLDTLAALPYYPDAVRFRAHTLAGWIELEAGDPAGALAALGPPVYGYAGILPGPSQQELPRNRYVRAVALARMGRYQEALRWMESFPEPQGSDMPYLPEILLKKARVLQALGREEEASAAFAGYLAHRRDADPAVRAALGRLDSG